ncbi:MAG: DUF2118 domain-containing protein [Crenarchaeota archaeon]|nr:DUF2118 domain-containing protein [Thermoproteota archaeon]
MGAYTYVKASYRDIEKLYDPTYFPLALSNPLESVLNPNCRVYVDRSKKVFSYRRLNSCEEFTEILTNFVVGIAIDPIKAVANLDTLAVYGEYGYLLEKGKSTTVVEARGKSVYPLVKEGSKVAKGERLFYVVTGKHEVRVVRSPIDGVLFAISELIPSEVQVLRAVLVKEHELTMLKRV